VTGRDYNQFLRICTDVIRIQLRIFLI